MKKRITRLFAFAMALVMVVALAACGKKKDETDNGGKTDLNALAGDYNIVVWVSESAGVTDLTYTQIKRFCEENPGIKINARIPDDHIC